MTSERRLLIGFNDVRAITLECGKCGARLSIKPDRLPQADVAVCPACRHVWIPGSSRSVQSNGDAWMQFLTIVGDLVRGAEPDEGKKSVVRVLLEIAEPT